MKEKSELKNKTSKKKKKKWRKKISEKEKNLTKINVEKKFFFFKW